MGRHRRHRRSHRDDACGAEQGVEHLGVTLSLGRQVGDIAADDFNLFVSIVGQQAAEAGVPADVIAAVAKALNSYFGSIVQA